MFKNNKIKLDNFEIRVIVNALNDKRTSLILKEEDTEIIDELILKYLDVLEHIKC